MAGPEPSPVRPLKRYAAASLVCALLIAVLTPAYVAHAEPSLARYLWHAPVFLMQAVPYAVCAAIWLPSRDRGAQKVALGLAILLLVVACVVYLPKWVHPEADVGDMVALLYVLICIATTGAVLAISLIAFGVLWWRKRRSRAAT